MDLAIQCTLHAANECFDMLHLPHIPHVFCAYGACWFCTSPLVWLPITCWTRGSACDREPYNAMDPCRRKTRACMPDSRVMGPTKGPQSKASNVEISGQPGVRHNPGHTACHNRPFRRIRVSGSKYSPSSPAQLNLSHCDRGGPVPARSYTSPLQDI